MANNLRNKMRRPTVDQNESSNSTSVQDSDNQNQCPSMECESPVHTKPNVKDDSDQRISVKPEVKHPQTGTLKVNFALESESNFHEPEICKAKEVHEKQIEKELETHPTSPTEFAPVVPITVEVQVEPPKKVRPTRKVAKKLDLTSDDEKVVPSTKNEEKTTESLLSTEEAKEQQRPLSNLEGEQQSENLPKKKLRRVRKPAEETTVAPATTITATVASPRLTRNQRNSVRPNNAVVPNSPRLVKTPSKLQEHIQKSTNNQFNPTNSSPVKRIFTPKLVFR